MQNIKEYGNNLSNYIIKKAKIAGSLSQAGSYINGLISQRSELENTLNNGSEYIYSKNSGVVSYRVDGLEEKLTIDNIENLKVEDLEKFNLTTGQIVGKSKKQAKIVNNFECYIAVPFGKGVLEKAKEGDTVKLRLSSQDKVNAKIYKVFEDENKIMVVFKITDNVEKLINYRKMSLDVIWWEYSGLMVPKDTILYENRLSYVIRKKIGTYEKILVKILKQNDNYCIIDNYETSELKELGLTSEEIEKNKTIKLYDEIMTKPELK